MPSSPGATVENAEVARIFREVAELLEVQNANPFRIRAYRNAARVVESHPRSVAGLAREGPEAVDALPGIGPDLAAKVVEIAETGTLAMLSGLAEEVPAGVADLMRIPGVGPRRALALCEALDVHDAAALERAAAAGRVRELPGFGARSEAKLLEELRARPVGEPRVLLATAAQYAATLLTWMRADPAVGRAEVAGSHRRLRETVGDLDLLVSAREPAAALARFAAFPEVEEVLAHGGTRAAVRLRSGLRVDLRVLGAESFGAGLHYFTGSRPHNIAVRALGRRRGLRISEYGVFRGGARIGGRTEEEVFAAVGLPWIPPELREDRGELDAAAAGTLPVLVERADLRGDLHCHTTASDGRDTLEAMAEAAQELGYAYLAVTDHTPSVRIAGGMEGAGFRRQWKEIDRLNARLRTLTLLKGAEVDILPDGSLDLDDGTLADCDVVVASLHAKLDLPREAQTERVLRALRHPSTDVLGHPTGRLIGRRRGAVLDLEAVARAAADHGVALELNAQPDRLDLDDVACRAAVGAGARIAISTDAHAVPELSFMRWGIGQARRGWVRKEDVLNALPLAELVKRLHRER
jgi:DNA polymerase (family X)